MDEYMTLKEAADKLGHRGYGGLRLAASQGRLRTIRKGILHLTTQAWLDEYLASLRQGNYKRGQPKGQDGGGEAGE